MKKNLSRLVSGLLAALFVMGLCTGALAASGKVSLSAVNVIFNGNQIGKTGESYALANGSSAPYSLSYTDEKGGSTTYLPIRKISELLGKSIGWNNATNSVLLGDAQPSVYTAGTGAALKGSTVKITEAKTAGKLIFYTLENGNGMKVTVMNKGSGLFSVKVPDKNGNLADVVLNRADPEKNNAMGPVIGRNANRIGDAAFTLNGVKYELEKNNGTNIGGPLVNNLHSGNGNLGNKYYTAEIKKFDNIPVLELSFKAPEGKEDLLPGDINVKVRYALTDDNKIVVSYWGASNKDTIINMTNHAYWNLSGHTYGDVFKHELQLNADYYTPVDDESIPTGEIAKVAGTPMDFTKSRLVYGTKEVPVPTRGVPVRTAIKTGFNQIDWFDGYDNNWVLNGTGYRKAATLFDTASGRAMDVYTTAPGVQMFTANGTKVGPDMAKDGANYQQYCGIALETQNFPDAPNKPWFPSSVVKAGAEYNSTTTFAFYNK